MRRRILVVGALAALLAVGCSDDGDSESAEPASSTETDQTEPADDAPSADDVDEGAADPADEAENEPTDSDDGGADDADEDPPPTTTGADQTTTTSDPGAEPEPDGDGFDVDREFSSDSEAENFGPIGSTETTIPTDEGEISIGGGDVPELGDEFPLPTGFDVQLSTEVEGEIGFSGRVDGEFADLVAFFERALPEAGYEIVEQQIVEGVLSVFTLDGPLAGDVVVSQEPGGAGWTILVALAEL